MGLLLTIVDHWKVNSHYYDRYQVLPSSNKHSRLHTPPFYEYYCWKKKEESWRAKGRERRAFWGASWAHWDTFVVWKNRKPDPIYQVQRSSGPFRRVVSAFFFLIFFFFDHQPSSFPVLLALLWFCLLSEQKAVIRASLKWPVKLRWSP